MCDLPWCRISALPDDPRGIGSPAEHEAHAPPPWSEKCCGNKQTASDESGCSCATFIAWMTASALRALLLWASLNDSQRDCIVYMLSECLSALKQFAALFLVRTLISS